MSLNLPPAVLADPNISGLVAEIGSLKSAQREFLESMMAGDKSVAELLEDQGSSPDQFRMWLSEKRFHSVYTRLAGALTDLYAVPAMVKRRYLLAAIDGAMRLDTASGYKVVIEGVEALERLDSPDDFSLVGFGAGGGSLKTQRHMHRAMRGAVPAVQINIGGNLRGEPEPPIEAKRVT